ncbi:hypothetical protein TH25_13845 [Thalassospira profundimaris]|uniref:Uncharacterized protein n=1 Tax=Thalassospira profundimaris TaxID=502049 RepID=A0A367X4T7_9PROT|nr:hypothetical protein TH25_13845 [Thalassospira profundimaris]
MKCRFFCQARLGAGLNAGNVPAGPVLSEPFGAFEIGVKMFLCQVENNVDADQRKNIGKIL